MRITFALLFALILLISAFFCVFPVKSQNHTITVPTDYPTINAAVGNATEGDTIMVNDGIYTEETIEINKTLNIISQNVDGASIILHPPATPYEYFTIILYSYANPIKIVADNVLLSGFYIKSDGGSINVTGAITQLTNNHVDPPLIISGNNCTITGNTLGDITLNGLNQTLTDNSFAHLEVKSSNNVIVRNSGLDLTVNGDHNLVNRNTLEFNKSTDGYSASGILIQSGNHNTISNNTITGQGTGIAIGYTGSGGSYNLFIGNSVQNTDLWGILMGNGSYNVFYGNLIANNLGDGHDGYGLAIGGNHLQVNSNLFFCNLFINNTKNFGVNWDINGTNYFDNGEKGNYWDDYQIKYSNAKEITTTGIGNQKYLVYTTDAKNHYDNYPLMNQPDVSGVVSSLPEPWVSLLQITQPNESQPATVLSVSANPTHSTTNSAFSTPTISPSPIATPRGSTDSIIDKTAVPQVIPSVEQFPFTTLVLVGIIVGGVGAIATLRLFKRNRSPH
jgi:nitrous oxidase accessory protein